MKNRDFFILLKVRIKSLKCKKILSEVVKCKFTNYVFQVASFSYIGLYSLLECSRQWLSAC